MPPDPFRFTLLGGVDLRRSDESTVQSILAQPKRVALLAYVAVEAPGGFVPRERVMSVLWPESDGTKARQSLRNGLYQLRQSLGEAVLVNRGAADVGVGGAHLRVDVVEFRKAVAAGRFAEAVDLFAGPFLSGFHLDDSPEFEEWAAGVRTAVGADALRAFRETARSREEQGDFEEARSLLRRAQEMAPADEEILRQRLLILARQGNRTGALAEGQEWIEKIRSSFEMEPSEATLRLMGEFRGQRAASADGRPAVERSTQLERTVPEPPRPAQPRKTRGAWRALTGWIVAPLLLLALAWASVADPPPLPTAAGGVIVERFDSDGVAGESAAGLALSALIARRLGAGGGGVVLPPDGISAASADGVERLLVSGRVRSDGKSLVAEVDVASTARPDEVLASASASVDHFDLETLAIRLVDDLERGTGQPLGSWEPVLPFSTVPAAIVPFFQGEILAESGRRSDAREAYARAVALDSTFAMAYFRLSVIEESLGLRDDALVSSDRAVALSPRMTPIERERLDAWRVYEWGVVEQALPLYEALAASRGPDRDAWLTLAEIRFHWGPQLGVPRAAADSAFAALLSITPGNADALLHRLRLMGPVDDSLVIDRVLLRLFELEPSEDVGMEARAVSDLNRRRTPGEDVAIWLAGGVWTLESRRLAQLAASAQAPWDLAPLVRSLPATEEPRRRVLRQLLVAQLAAASGRMSDARAELDSLARRNPARALEYRIAIELASPVAPSLDTLRSLRERLRRTGREPGPASPLMVDAAEPGIYLPRALVLDAMLTRRLGEEVDSTALMARGRTAGLAFEPDYAEYVRLEAMGATGSHERLIGFLGPGRPEWHRARPDPLSYLVGISRWSRAESLLAVGRDEDALRWMGTFPDVGGYDLVFTAEASLLGARILERRGRRAAAAAAYRRALEVWDGADPDFDALVEEAREGMGRTGSVPQHRNRPAGG